MRSTKTFFGIFLLIGSILALTGCSLGSGAAAHLKMLEYPRIDSLFLVGDDAFACKVMPNSQEAYWMAAELEAEGEELFKKKIPPEVDCFIGLGLQSDGSSSNAIMWMESGHTGPRYWLNHFLKGEETPLLEDWAWVAAGDGECLRISESTPSSLPQIADALVYDTDMLVSTLYEEVQDEPEQYETLLAIESLSQDRIYGSFPVRRRLPSSQAVQVDNNHVVVAYWVYVEDSFERYGIPSVCHTELHLVQLEPFAKLASIEPALFEVGHIGKSGVDGVLNIVGTKFTPFNDTQVGYFQVKIDLANADSPLKIVGEHFLAGDSFVEPQVVFPRGHFIIETDSLEKEPEKIGILRFFEMTSSGLAEAPHTLTIPSVDAFLDIEFSHSGNTATTRESANTFTLYRYDGEQHVRVGTVSTIDGSGIQVQYEGKKSE